MRQVASALASGSSPCAMRQPSVIKVETFAMRRIDFAHIGRHANDRSAPDQTTPASTRLCATCPSDASLFGSNRSSPELASAACGPLRFRRVNLPSSSARQFAVQAEVSDFLEVRLLRHLVNVVAAIHQARIRIDPADRVSPAITPARPGL